MQDLEDIRNGIQIVHDSDMEKRDSENKRERRRQSRESAVRRLEKKLLENGYESLEEYSTDRRHADKWLGPERIAELENLRRLKEKERKEQPVQLSLFDMEALYAIEKIVGWDLQSYFSFQYFSFDHLYHFGCEIRKRLI